MSKTTSVLNYDLLKDLVKSGLVPYLVGPRGEGKTTYAREFGNHLGIWPEEIAVLNLSTIDSADLSGMPYTEEGVLKYAPPAYFRHAKLIILDEVDRIRDQSVKTGLLSLLLDRAINGNELRQDAVILTCGNGTGKNDENIEYDTVEMDEALKDRLIEVPFRYSIADKISYLKNKYPTNQFVKFLEAKPTYLTKASSRRLEAFIKTGNNSLCSIMLGDSIARPFKEFLDNSVVGLADLIQGNVEASKLSVMARSVLIKELTNGFYALHTHPDLSGIPVFVADLAPEEQAVYFKSLANMYFEAPDKFKRQFQILKPKGAFTGQKAQIEKVFIQSIESL